VSRENAHPGRDELPFRQTCRCGLLDRHGWAVGRPGRSKSTGTVLAAWLLQTMTSATYRAAAIAMAKLAALDAAIRMRELRDGDLDRSVEEVSRQLDEMSLKLEDRRRDQAAGVEFFGDESQDVAKYRVLFNTYQAVVQDARLRRRALERELSGLESTRVWLTSQVPEEFLASYEALLEEGRIPGIVPIASGFCGGCNVRIPREELGSLALRCPNCERFLIPAGIEPHSVPTESHRPVRERGELP
jgi:hypothetical protein